MEQPLGGAQVLPKHVKEAYRLLNKSIIRVEQPDINLYEEEEEGEAMELDPAAETPNGVDDAAASREVDAAGSVAPEKEKKTEARGALTLSYEEYKKVANLLVLHLLKEEARSEGESPVRIQQCLGGVPSFLGLLIVVDLLLRKVGYFSRLSRRCSLATP